MQCGRMAVAYRLFPSRMFRDNGDGEIDLGQPLAFFRYHVCVPLPSGVERAVPPPRL